ncbi:MAG: DNA internalization-related competence protein ComEC/Rec2 [Ignavibacteriales bacterium UTCHB3]|nr:MAG: DNA internalization-related competence protein ComEC/Rec2 [Ignavibacteriales bacterium UTCHB3]
MKHLRFNDLLRFPALIAAPGLMVGILVNDYGYFPLWFSLPVSVTALLLILIFKLKDQNRLIPLLALLFGFASGAATISVSNASFQSNPLGKLKQSDADITAKISEIRVMTYEKISFTGEVSLIRYDSTAVDTMGKKRTKRHFTVTKKFTEPPTLLFQIKNPDTALYKSFKQQLLPGREISLQGRYANPLNRRNPGGFDYAEYLKRERISAIVYVYPDSTYNISGQPDLIAGSIYSFRQSIGDKIDQLHDKYTAPILKGLIIADRSTIDPEIMQNYIDTGIAHILAVSGFNVAVIYLITLLFFQRLKPYSRGAELFARILILFLFLILTQFQVTVVRAVVMFSVYSLLKYSGRETTGWNTLSITIILILLVNPQDLFSTSFQLSVAAVVGLFLAENIKSEVFRVWRGYFGEKSKKLLVSKPFFWVAEMVLVTLFVQLIMLPFLVVYFGRVTLLSIPANIIAVPLSSFMLVNGILTLFLSLISNFLASLSAAVSGLANSIIDYTIGFLRHTNWGTIEIYDSTAFEAFAFYALIALSLILISAANSFKKKSLIVLATAVCILLSHIMLQTPLLKPEENYIITVDVDQGDCYILKTASGEVWLIDAGVLGPTFDTGEAIIIPLLKRFGIEKIQHAFVSHYDLDHAGGMISLMKKGLIKQLNLPPPDPADTKEVALFSILAKYGKHKIYKTGDLFSANGLSLKVFNQTPETGAKSNSRSGVFMVNFATHSVLFTGDLDRKGEKALMETESNLRSEILKVSHHGSSTGTSRALLEEVKPAFALISAGVGNRYRHPSQKVLQRLEEANTETFRTDLEGCIILQLDEGSIKKVNWR